MSESIGMQRLDHGPTHAQTDALEWWLHLVANRMVADHETNRALTRSVARELEFRKRCAEMGLR